VAGGPAPAVVCFGGLAVELLTSLATIDPWRGAVSDLALRRLEGYPRCDGV